MNAVAASFCWLFRLVESASSRTLGFPKTTEGKIMGSVLATLALLAVAPSAVAGEKSYAGNARAGRETAEAICAPCHVVAEDQEQAPPLKPPAQPFAEIARGPKSNNWTLQAFLASTHSSVSHPANMPNPQLSEEQIRDVTAYILSLRERKEQDEPRKRSD